MSPWLNPKNWIKAYKTAMLLWEGATSLWKAILTAIKAIEKKKEDKHVKEALKDLQDANQIEDEDERLKKKSDAACRLEKVINPGSDC